MPKYPYRIVPFKRQLKAMRMIYRTKTVGLFWEMGSGKTKVILDFIGVMLFNHKISRALIICKLRGIPTWEDEFQKNMLPGVRYTLLRNEPRRLGWEKSQVFITNYDYARTHREELEKLEPDVIAIDESHRIKNPHARQSRLAHHLSKVARYRICLTGTEIGNHILDLWSQFRFIKPDLLPEKFKEFKQQYIIYAGFGGFKIHKYRNMPKLAKLLAPYISVQKSDTGVTERFIDVPIDMPHEAKKLYKEMEEQFVAWVTKTKVINASIVLAKLIKLSQISGGFIHDTEENRDYPVHRAKLETLKELVDNLQEQNEQRVVIFARFVWELEQIREMFSNWTVYMIKGGVTLPEQKLAETLFRTTGGMMLCQIDSGSESMNLQSSRYTFFYSVNYSSISYQQAIKRTNRTGQKAKTCYYYRLICRGTTDRRQYSILQGKKDIRDQVRSLVEDAKAGRLSA